MERHRHLLILFRILVVLMGLLPILLTEGLACEACDRLFLAQLQGPERSGTLVSKELLATIAAQEHVGRNNPASVLGIAPGGLSGSANLTAQVGAADAGTAYAGDGQATPVRSLSAGQSDGRAVASLAGEGGGQTVTAGPSDSWVVEFRIPPDEGSYLMLSHAVGSTDRGALGLLICDRDAPPAKTVLSDGIVYSEAEMDVFREQALRTITPFGIGSPDVDVPVVYGPDTDEVIVRIIGNSYHPKVIHVAPGTTVRWINEDVFTYMEGRIVVNSQQPSDRQYANAGPATNSSLVWFILVLAALALMVAIIGLIPR